MTPHAPPSPEASPRASGVSGSSGVPVFSVASEVSGLLAPADTPIPAPSPDLEALLRQLELAPLRPCPRNPREPFASLPFLVGLLASLLLHASLVPVAVYSVHAAADTRRAQARLEADERDRQPTTLRIPLPQPESEEDELRLGRDAGDPLSSAWLHHDDPRPLQAPKSTVLQPALQTQADPTQNAPLILDATAPTPPPLPSSPEASPQAFGVSTSKVSAFSGASMASASAPRLPDTLTTPDLQRFDRLTEGPTQNAPEAPPTDLAPQPTDTPLRTPKPDGERSEPSESSPPSAFSPPPSSSPAPDPRPTSSARSDREATPVTLDGALEIKPGGVVAGEGIEIKTIAPRFSAVTRAIAAPVNPVAVLTFDPTGRVIDVTLTTSSGFENVDGPVLASLYKWQATGEKIRQLKGPLKITVKVLLRRE